MNIKSTLPVLSKLLVKWYKENSRTLPWRINRDPYRIWISEVMLQQTTVTAVIPFYERFMERFPNLRDLASATIEEVYGHWAGLGYYSRARNLHRAAQELAKINFPQTANELIQYPGFGPYTSRAVASLAFSEPVGVLDGNVIRVLTRVHGLQIAWWKPEEKNKLQKLSDQLAQLQDPYLMNQALMELGATVCTPKKPACLICPWMKHCVSFENQSQMTIPRQKPRKKSEIWVWKPQVIRKGSQICLAENHYVPFLKKTLLFPGQAEISKKKPKKFDLRHTITHHNIYIQIDSKVKLKGSIKGAKWVEISEIKTHNPSILLQKVLHHCFKNK
ncbi:MAG: hypothetical protein BroJett040_13580 [Oligoflexia bacterium]|nr:MAG: hypothetical protein BroJett040_13580 [Oligoflexia bacterium]